MADFESSEIGIMRNHEVFSGNYLISRQSHWILTLPWPPWPLCQVFGHIILPFASIWHIGLG